MKPYTIRELLTILEHCETQDEIQIVWDTLEPYKCDYPVMELEAFIAVAKEKLRHLARKSRRK